MSTSTRIILKNELPEISRGVDHLEEFGQTNKIPSKIIYDFAMAFDELVTNIISYGYGDNNTHEIIIELKIDDGYMTAMICDDAKPFNPLEQPAVDVSKPVEDRQIGGLGIFLVRNLMETVAYEYKDGRNIFKMMKKTN